VAVDKDCERLLGPEAAIKKVQGAFDGLISVKAAQI
jgi:hypothetical protein